MPRSQAQRLFQAGDAKGVGVGQRSRGLEKTVSVGVRFHYRNQFAGGRQFTQTLQVVSQSAAVDNYSCRLHLNSLIKKAEGLLIIILRTGIIIETRPLAVKGQSHGADRTVTLFTNDNFRDAFKIAVLVIDLITVNEHD